jgi:hypothetical protein
MNTKEKIPNISQISTFDENFPIILKDILENSSNPKKDDQEKSGKNYKTCRYIMLSVPLEKVIPLHSDAARLIKWIYDTDKRDRALKTIPKEIRGDLDYSTIAGILWKLAKKNRARIMPPPFLIIMGKYSDVKGSICICTKEAISVPAPDFSQITDEIESIRWIEIHLDHVDYWIRVYHEMGSIADVPDAGEMQ